MSKGKGKSVFTDGFLFKVKAARALTRMLGRLGVTCLGEARDFSKSVVMPRPPWNSFMCGFTLEKAKEYVDSYLDGTKP